jgi:segregation and condensation protein B
VPGRPALYATTKAFLDYFGLKALDQLPPLPEILALADIDLTQQLDNETPAEKQMQLPELDAENLVEVHEEINAEATEEIEM